ncbi:MAG: hypothetical protein WD227_15055 [Vicinamibacterales bacterium]
MVLTVTGRLVNALDRGQGVAGVIKGQGFGEVTTQADGTFAVQVNVPGPYRVSIAAAGFVERETGLQIPGPHAEISLIPASFDLVTYDQLARAQTGPPGSGMTRWVNPPRLLIYTRLIDCTSGGRVVVLAEVIPDEEINAAIAVLREALDGLSGGAFRDFVEVIRDPGTVGETRHLDDIRWSGTIHVGACPSISNGSDGAGRILRPDRSFVPSIAAAFWKKGPAPSRLRATQQHELGHALGLSHTFTATPSIMSETKPGLSVGWFDRLAGQIMFQRPPGNRSPDIDPESFVVNGGM